MAKAPLDWSATQDGLGGVLLEMGERAADPALALESVTARRAALKIHLGKNSGNLKDGWNNLGVSLQGLGELTRSEEHIGEAEDALRSALSLKNKRTDLLDWAITQNNLAHAQRWLGELTGNLSKLDEARTGYAACEALEFEDKAPFNWARLQWNIADLALARFRLDPDPALLTEACNYIAMARAFFVDGSDNQTQRCDDLLAQVEAAAKA